MGQGVIVKKGSLVHVREIGKSTTCFKHLTAADRQKWTDDWSELVKNGVAVWYNDSGDPVETPLVAPVHTRPDKFYIIVRARCSAQKYHGKVTGLCEVCDPETGETFYAFRSCVTPVEET